MAFIGHYPDPEEIMNAPLTESDPYFEEFASFVFTADSIFKIDYPLELKRSSAYSIDTNYLTYSFEEQTFHMPIRQSGDTLYLYQFGDQGYSSDATYAKAQINDIIIDFLKQYQNQLSSIGRYMVFKT